jgi:hypothetical protein
MNDSLTSASVISLTWEDGLSEGGTPILDFTVSYDQAIGNYIELETGVMTRSYSTSVPLVAGNFYKFKV